jgi:signal transduction histidine kinase
MDFNIAQNLEYCKEFVDFFSSLVYYSHIPTALIGLFLSIYVFYKSRTLISRILLYIAVTFLAWVTLDLLIWINYDNANIIMSAWAPVEIFSLFLLCLYFLEVFTTGKDVDITRKIFYSSLLLPLIISAPTTFYLHGYDMQECVAIEDPYYLQYVLYLKIILSVYIFVLAIIKYHKAKPEMKPQIAILSTGILTFILSFFVAGVISERTGNYSYELYGLFGIAVFMGLLAYLITKFKTFKVRIFSVQFLVLTLIILVASQYAFITNPINKILNAFTLLLIIVFGYILMRSVKREIEAKENLEKLAKDLQKANARLIELDKQKTEFVSFASHQLRSPLTAMKGYTSLILEGDFGEINPEMREAVERVYDSSTTLANVVSDYLNISRIELGTMKYEFSEVEFDTLVSSVIKEMKPNIEKTGLSIDFTFDKNETFKIWADQDKFKQIIGNLIDNSIKYTKHGGITVNLKKDTQTKKILFSVKDTGIGMRADIIPKLFQKFMRANNANEANIRGTGLGLYVAKEIILAHKGRIWAESEGEGKGSQFYVEMDEKV